MRKNCNSGTLRSRRRGTRIKSLTRIIREVQGKPAPGKTAPAPARKSHQAPRIWRPKTFLRSYDKGVYEGYYISRNSGAWQSPAFTVASVAKRILKSDGSLSLPTGYDAESVDELFRQTGRRDQETHLTESQAREIAQIGQELVDNFPGDMNAVQRNAVTLLLQTVSEPLLPR